KRTWRKWTFQVVAEAVGMWEARVLCELPKRCWKRGKALLLFLSSNTAVISIAVLLLFVRHRLQYKLMAIESCQGKGGKTDVPVAIVGLLHADEFSPQTLADKDLCTFPEEGSIRIDSLRLQVGVVFRFGNSIRIAARRTAIARGRRLLLQRLMRPLLVELLAEPIKN